MWRDASEAYAYLAGHPFLTDTVLHNRKTDNDRQIINKQHAAAEINRVTNQHKITAGMDSLTRESLMALERTFRVFGWGRVMLGGANNVIRRPLLS